MITNELDITINRPIQEVFAYVSDLQNSANWQTGLVELKGISAGPQVIGAQFTGVRNFMGHKMESIVQLTNFDRNKLFAYKSISGSSPFHQSFLFETTAGGTKVTTAIELETTGLLGLPKPIIASSLKRAMGTDFAKLKKQLEERPL